MELVQEVYENLKVASLDWPEHAVVAVRDNDGEIKFSSVGKYDIEIGPSGNVYMRGPDCLFNNRLVDVPVLDMGTPEAMDIITRSEYESYYYAREDK